MEQSARRPTLTREEWIAAADRLLLPLDRYRSASSAVISLPGRPSWSGERSDGLEGFARSLLLLAFRVVAEPQRAQLLDRYRDGLIAGTTVGHPDAWPPLTARGQSLVEAASIVVALDLTRDLLWETLDAHAQRRVADWLSPSGHVETPPNNWVLFRLIIQEFLAGCGFPFHAPAIDGALERWETWYRGDGWFSDGDGQRFDYYNAWALHFYPFVWSRMHGRRDPARAEQVRLVARERLREFLLGHVRFFGGDGMPIYQGRSLIYRFASLSALWMGEIEGVSPLSPGALRRLASSTLTGFLDSPAIDPRGLLTSGWLGEFPAMVQPYSGPASPYWASKGFLGLLLPANAPVWTAPEEETPVEQHDSVVILRSPGFMLTTTSSDGLARLVNHGSDNHPPLTGVDDPHYSRLAYSSATAPSFDREPVDNHIALIDDSGRGSCRGAIRRVEVGVHGIGSQHSPFWVGEGSAIISPRGCAITTASVAHGAFIVHVHIITTEAPGDYPFRIGGFAVASAVEPRVGCAPSAATAETDRLTSALHSLTGTLTPGIVRSRSTSPYGTEVAVPILTGQHSGARTVHVVATELRGAGAEVAPPPSIASMDATQTGVRVSFRFSDDSVKGVTVPYPVPTQDQSSHPARPDGRAGVATI